MGQLVRIKLALSTEESANMKLASPALLITALTLSTTSSALCGLSSSALAMETPRPCSPISLIDDLTESALHLAPEQTKTSAPPGNDSAVQKLEAAGRLVPHILNYRASQAAAKAFLGAPTTCQSHEEEAVRCHIELKLVTALLQLADSLNSQGIAEEKQGMAKDALGAISELTGTAQAQWLLDKLLAWAKTKHTNLESSSPVPAFSWLEEERNLDLLRQKAVENDRRINTLKSRLAAYKISPSSTEKTLTVVSYAPIIFASLAKLAQVGIEKANGGTRAQRLDEVVSLGLAIEERNALLARLSSLALEAQQAGYHKRNDTLLQLGKDLQDWLSAKGPTGSTASVR
jgi:hypothetical protein